MFNDLDQLVLDGYVSRKKHPSKNIHILNYTPKAQFDRLWNNTTMSCRGLILNDNGDVVARPFRKFFNFEEVRDEVLSLYSKASAVDIYEKLDGSLGVVYFHDGVWSVATRGSFISDQSFKATSLLHSKYADVVKNLNPDYTYLVEIIYPENKVVVNYGAEEILPIIAAINTKSGVEDLDISSVGFPCCRKFSFDLGSEDIFQQLKAMNFKNEEGFVIRLDNSYRFKIKFEDYLKQHKAIFGLSSKIIWQSLRDKTAMDLTDVPDETFAWVKSVQNDLNGKYADIENSALKIFATIDNLPRKDFALSATKTKFAGILFKMLDKKDYSDIIWKQIEPEFFTERKDNSEV